MNGPNCGKTIENTVKNDRSSPGKDLDGKILGRKMVDWIEKLGKYGECSQMVHPKYPFP